MACVAVLAALAFGGLAWDVVGHHGLALTDPRVTAWVVARRTGWLTAVLRTVTWLGSSVVIIPVALTVAIFFAWRRRRWGPLALLAAAIAGAAASYTLIKAAVGAPAAAGDLDRALLGGGVSLRPRGPVGRLLRDGRRDPGAGGPPVVKTALWSAAALVALVVGRVPDYLGAHWLTDVLGGYALGAFLVAVIVIVSLALGEKQVNPFPPPATAHVP